MKYYVAYGSNLSIEQMRMRCPDARVAGVSALKDYRLLFRLHATIEPCEGAYVPVVVWEISDADERSLDRYEGWPRYYRKELVILPLFEKTVPAMVYIMNGRSGVGVGPTDSYLETIRKGYDQFLLPYEVLDQAVAES